MRIARRRPPKRRLLPALGAGAAAVGAIGLGAAGVLLRRRRRAHDERSSMSQANKATARRFLEDAFNKGDLDVIDEICLPTVVDHDPAMPADTSGIEALKQLVAGYRAAFPDLRMTVEEQVGEGDLVATRWTARGTHEGELMGVAPSGKQATVTGITLDRFEDGRIAESWTNWDTLGLLKQLGAVPMTSQV